MMRGYSTSEGHPLPPRALSSAKHTINPQNWPQGSHHVHTDVLILNLGAGFTFVTFNNPKYKHHLYYYSFNDSGIWLGFIKS